MNFFVDIAGREFHGHMDAPMEIGVTRVCDWSYDELVEGSKGAMRIL